jgi:hypothetical protein
MGHTNLSPLYGILGNPLGFVMPLIIIGFVASRIIGFIYILGNMGIDNINKQT